MTEATERRSSPWVGQIVLLVMFAALAVVGVLTVLVPEISDDAEAEAAPSSAEASGEDATSDEPPSDEPPSGEPTADP